MREERHYVAALDDQRTIAIEFYFITPIVTCGRVFVSLASIGATKSNFDAGSEAKSIDDFPRRT